MNKLPAHLSILEDSGLIRVAQIQPEMEYLFRHGLVQDAAYDSLLRQDRKKLHRAVSKTLERAFAKRLTELAPLLARHFEAAGDAANALHYLVLAGDSASAQYANSEAIAFYTRAIDLVKAEGIDAGMLKHLYIQRGHALEHHSDFEAALKVMLIWE